MNRKTWPEIDLLDKTQCSNLKNTLDISWSSSSSDTEEKHNFKYRKKVKVSHKQISGITSTKSNKQLGESPIFSQSAVEELSPTFNECEELNKSPVISKGSRNKHWKKNIYSEKFADIESSYDSFTVLNRETKSNISETFVLHKSQPEESIFLTQCINSTNYNRTTVDQKISNTDIEATISQNSSDVFLNYSQIDFTSPIKSTQSESSLLISQSSNTQESQNYAINDSLSPNKSAVSGNFNSGNSQISSPNGLTLYSSKLPRKKKYKKGGLAIKLQKAIQCKKANISIWKHELYINKNQQCEDCIKLQVCKIFIEFGCLLCECNYLNKTLNSDHVSRKCIVIFDRSVEENIECFQQFKLYRPYSVAQINYLKENIYCYYNLCKILIDNE